MRLDSLGVLLLAAAVACGGDDDGAADDDGAGGDGAAIDAGDTTDDAGTGDDAAPGADGGTGDACGGLLDIKCDDTHFCDWADDSCGKADRPGTCTPRPSENDCAREMPPVCGCDQQRYDSACEAQMAGTDVAEISICGAASPEPSNAPGAQPR